MDFRAIQDSGRLQALSLLTALSSSLAIGSMASIPMQSHAMDTNIAPTIQSPVGQRATLQSILDISFRQPNTRETGDPQDRPRGGGSRCGEDSVVCLEEMIALVPFQTGMDLNHPDQETALAWGQTLQSNPTLWFYLPYSEEVVYAAELELWNMEGDRIFHTTELPIPAKPGIVGYTLPDTVALEVQSTYRWHLLVQFDALNPSSDALVSGRIQRVSLSSPQQLSTISPSEQAQLLAEEGIWYDLLTTMATAYPQDNASWQTAWQNLLTEVGLTDVAHISLESVQLQPIAQENEGSPVNGQIESRVIQ